jgi:uncharacterized protein YbjT (DUF2867 family)
MKKIAVTTPAGQIGKHVVKALLKSGHPVVAVGLERHRTEFTDSIGKGLEFRAASHDDSASLIDATADASALFWLTPPTTSMSMREWYETTSLAAAKVIERNKFDRVVNISSLGAGMRAGLGTVSYVGKVEEKLNKVARNIVHLRPGYFMENLLLQRNQLANGYFEFPYAPDHDLPWISAADIGESAAHYLSDPSWSGKLYVPLMGPENLTCVELAEKLSKVLGKKIEYRQTRFSDLRESLIKAGLTSPIASELTETMMALGDSNGIYAHPRTHETATRTTIEDFVRASAL